MDIGELASRLKRDYTIMAKRHHDMARDCRAIADTWGQVLDATPANLLPPPVREEDVAAFTQPTLEFGSGAKGDYD